MTAASVSSTDGNSHKQRRRSVVALVLLVAALTLLAFRDAGPIAHLVAAAVLLWCAIMAWFWTQVLCFASALIGCILDPVQSNKAQILPRDEDEDDEKDGTETATPLVYGIPITGDIETAARPFSGPMPVVDPDRYMPMPMVLLTNNNQKDGKRD